jgi:hypothetical protein
LSSPFVSNVKSSAYFFCLGLWLAPWRNSSSASSFWASVMLA